MFIFDSEFVYKQIFSSSSYILLMPSLRQNMHFVWIILPGILLLIFVAFPFSDQFMLLPHLLAYLFNVIQSLYMSPSSELSFFNEVFDWLTSSFSVTYAFLVLSW